MNDDASELWQVHGTSLVWDPDALQAVVERNGCSVSLRQALAWSHPGAMPDEPPGGVRAVVVTGLQEALDVLPAEQLGPLMRQVRSLVRVQSRYWPEAALVFAIRNGSALHVSPPTGSLRVRLRSGGEFEIGQALWGGADKDAVRLLAVNPGEHRPHPIGYWLRRVS